MKRLSASVSAFVFALPAVVFGQAPGQIGSLFTNILNFVAGVISFLGPLLISIALLVFFYSLVQFLYNKDDAGKSKAYLGYSILILFVMVSIWGIVGFIQSNLNIRGDDLQQTPGVPITPFNGLPNNNLRP